MNVIMIAGSNRKDASSTKVLKYIGGLLQNEGIEARLFDLHETPLPMYSPDSVHEHEHVTKLKQWMTEANAIVLATPEYHSGISGVLKNALDTLSGEHFADKVVLSVSAAGGQVGSSSLQQLQTIVRNLHGINSPEWISIGGSQQAFTSSGVPQTQAVENRIQRAVSYFVQLSNSVHYGIRKQEVRG
jgi:azobenzene reductase